MQENLHIEPKYIKEANEINIKQNALKEILARY